MRIAEQAMVAGTGDTEAQFYGTTASTRRGKDSVLRILRAARSIFAEGGYGGLSLREVARASGMYLANVQHYFATREDLLISLLRFIVAEYDVRYREFAGKGNASPREFFIDVLRYLLDDIKNPDTSKIFFELWSLAQRHPHVTALVDWMYVHHRRNIEGMIAAISPAMPEAQRRLRAALIATQIEGLMVLLATQMPRHEQLAGIEDACIEQALRLAAWP
jgi:AcrR family transcriptional regulator